MKGEILALISALLWGIAPLFDKYVVSTGVSPYLANLIRVSGALLFLAVVTFIAKDYSSAKLTVKSIAYLLIAGTIASGVAMIVYFQALKLTQASRVVPITSIYPLFTVIFSALLLGENISPKVVVGAVLIVIGLSLVCGE
ncbi:EamA family transporter [Archaeoglobus sp.]